MTMQYTDATALTLYIEKALDAQAKYDLRARPIFRPLVDFRPGILTITAGGTHQKVIVLGGLAEMSENGLTVLADVATSLEDLDRAQFAESIAEMETKLAEKEGSELDHAIERLDHYKSIQQELNATAMH